MKKFEEIKKLESNEIYARQYRNALKEELEVSENLLWFDSVGRTSLNVITIC